MSRKHNTRHQRGKSHYKDRLAKRGQSSATVRMPAIADLARTQNARYSRTGSWWFDGARAGGEDAE